MIKYAMNAHIILLEDFNASLHRKKPLTRYNRLQSFLEEFKTTTCENQPTDYTYVHGKGNSIINYVPQSEAMVVKRVKVQSDYSENTSPHCPVTADMVQIPGIIINASKYQSQ